MEVFPGRRSALTVMGSNQLQLQIKQKSGKIPSSTSSVKSNHSIFSLFKHRRCLNLYLMFMFPPTHRRDNILTFVLGFDFAVLTCSVGVCKLLSSPLSVHPVALNLLPHTYNTGGIKHHWFIVRKVSPHIDEYWFSS